MFRLSNITSDELSKLHNTALAQGYSQFRNIMKIWTVNNAEWVPDTLLVSGISVFWFITCRNNPTLVGLDHEEYHWLKSQLEISDIHVPPTPSCSEESLFDTIWYYSTFYSELSHELRRMFNETAYKISADRCWRVKHICLDPPKIPNAPKLISLLQNYTPFDTAQLIICFTLDSYLPNHIRCCAATLDDNRCEKKRDPIFHPDFCCSHALDPNTIAVSAG